MSIFESVLATPETLNLFGDRSLVEAMLRCEAARARAQAQAGRMPESAAHSIVGSCKVELFDVSKIVRDSARAGSIAQPLLRSLREAVGLFNPQAVPFVHAGACERGLADAAMALQTRAALRLIDADLERAARALLAHAERHANLPMLRRDGARPVAVTSFGLRCAEWAAPLVRSRERLHRAAALGLRPHSDAGDPAALLEAAAGTGAMAGEAGESADDAPAVLACELGLMVGSLGRIAFDIALLGQPGIAEVDEAGERAGGADENAGASVAEGTPAATAIALAAAQRVPARVALLLAALPQARSSAFGGWLAEQAEWPPLLMAAHGSVRALATMLPNLRIDARRMRSHIDRLHAELPRGAAREAFDPTAAEAAAVAALSQALALRGRLDAGPVDR